LIWINGDAMGCAWLALAMEVAMRQSRVKHVILAATVLVGGTMGSIEWQGGSQSSLMRGDFTISATAVASETAGPSRRTSCTLVRYYVARYTAAVAEAWARGKGVSDAEIRTARRCIENSATG
jgi:hypothetical protein